jgi:putative flippase GtrA
MSRWRKESAYISRYAGGGAVNTLAGFAVIFLLMWMGISPFIANGGGYLVGLTLGFFISRKFVFRSAGKFAAEGTRYLATFLICFAMNLLVLEFVLIRLHWNANLAQLIAAGSYTVSMYVLARWLVFTPCPER